MPIPDVVRSLAMWSVLVALAAPVGATDYYVSSSLGNDAWSGLLPEPDGTGTDGPLRTLAPVDALLENAQPGDRILFRRGDVWAQSTPAFDVEKARGLETDPIVVGAYGTGNRPRFDIDGTGRIIFVRGSDKPPASHVVFENLHLTTTAQPGNRPQGIQTLQGPVNDFAPHHLTFRDLVVEGLTYGLSIASDDTLIEDCLIRDNFKIAPESGHSQGIWAHGENVTIRGNVIENNGKPDSWFDWNTYLSDGSYLYENNQVSRTVSGIKLRKVRDTIVRGNVFHDLNLVGISIGGDVDGGVDNVVIERNLIYDAIDGIAIRPQSSTGPSDPGITNLIVRNNILHSRKAVGTFWGGNKGYLEIDDYPLHDVSIYNNVISGVVPDKRNLAIRSSAFTPTNLRIKSNVLSRSDAGQSLAWLADAAVLGGIELDHNLYDCPGCILVEVGSADYFDLGSLRAAHPGQETSGQEGAPEFVDAPNSFLLTEQSILAIDQGAEAAGIVDSDFAGDARPAGAGWDIGAYEFGASPLPIPAAPTLLP